MKIDIDMGGIGRAGVGRPPKGRTGLGALRSLTRNGRLQMLEELARMCDEVEHLASRERARLLSIRPASELLPLAQRTRPTAARWHASLVAGGEDGPVRGELVTLHRTFTRAVQAARHNLESHNA